MNDKDFVFKTKNKFVLVDISCDSKAKTLLSCSETENPKRYVEITAMI